MYKARLAVTIFVLGAALGFSLSAHASAADLKAEEFVVCKSSKAVRTLSITPDASKSGQKTCKVTYTKAGVPETVGEHTTNSSCHSILDHVKERLENSKWNCKEVSATMTTSIEVLTQ
jgi:hypothetical protein